jgi:hypothetical protein
MCLLSKRLTESHNPPEKRNDQYGRPLLVFLHPESKTYVSEVVQGGNPCAHGRRVKRIHHHPHLGSHKEENERLGKARKESLFSCQSSPFFLTSRARGIKEKGPAF